MGTQLQGFVVAENEFRSHPYSWGKKRPPLVSKSGVFPEDALTKCAIDYLKLPHRRPFFLMLSHYYVHTPVDTPCMWLIGKYQKKIPPGTANRVQRAKYAACVETLDHYVGQVLAALKATGKRDKTLVVFTSDNGGHPEFTGNAPFRGSKWNLYEGGIRVPFLVRWPRRTDGIKPGSVCHTAVCSYDLVPTFAEVAGKPIDPAKESLDGRSLVPFFLNPQQRFDRALYWHFPYYHPEGSQFAASRPRIGASDFAVSQTRPVSAIRRGKFKLLHFLEDDRLELYDLAADPAESRNLVKTDAEAARKLKEELQRTLKEAGARMPRKVISR